MTERKTASRLLLILSAAAAALAVALGVWYAAVPAAGAFHADCSDTLYWANASFESGSIVSRSFSYSALLPFGGQLLYLPLIALFGFSMKTQLIGMVLFTLLFAAALFFFFRSLGFSYRRTFFSLAVTELCFLHSDKLREMFFEHVIYYSLGLLLFALLLGLVLRTLRDGDLFTPGRARRRALCYGVLSLLLAAAAGTDGVQILVLAVAPVLFALFFERLLDGKVKLLSRENRSPALLFAGLGVGAFLGFLFLKLVSHGVIAGYAEGYSTYDTMTDWGENLLAFPRQYFSLLGVSVEQRDPLFDFASLLNILRIGAGLLILTLPRLLLFRYRRIREQSTRLLLLAHLFVSAFVLFGFVFGNLAGACWRLIPLFGTALFCSLAALRELSLDGPAARRMGALCAAVLLLLSAAGAGGTLAVAGGERENEALWALAETLSEKNLTYGYADYWEAQALTVIGGPDLRVRDVRLDEDDGLERYPYQSSAAWYEDQPGVDSYFVLLDTSDYFHYVRSDAYLARAEHVTEETSVGDFFLIVFDCNPLGDLT